MKSIVLSLILMCTLTAYSQKQAGVCIVNEKDEPVAGAFVCVFNAATNTLLSSVMTDSTGYAGISNVNFDKEVLKVMAFGYQDVDINSMPSKEVLQVKLIPLQAELEEVVVLASSLITQKSDRFVFSLANPNLTKGNTTYEILRFTPFIRIDDVSRSVSMIGKEGVQLYINGRKSNLPAGSIRSYLETLPAEKIESIEIITDPGVTMRTEGNQGVINLVLKKNESDGINGTLTATDSQKKLNSPEMGVYFNYQKGKFNLSSNLFAGKYRFDDKSTSEYLYVSSENRQSINRREKPVYNELEGSIRADYNLSDKQVIGLVFNGSYNKNTNKQIDRTSYGTMFEPTIDSIIYSDNRTKSPIQNYVVNVNYRLKTSEKGNLSIDLDYLRNKKEQIVRNNFSQVEQGIELPPYESFRQNSEEILTGYSGKIEYKHAFDNQNNIAVGADAYSNSSDADFFYGILQNGSYVSDPQKTNAYSYEESYAGAYVSFSRIWSDKFNSRIEARIETFNNKGVQQVTSEKTKHDYVDILPTLSLQYQINASNRLSYNFSSYVGRPGYYSLNPFRFYLTPTTYKEYNPNLTPTYTYNNTLNYSLKGNYIVNLSYTYTKDCTNNFLVPVDEQYTKYLNANYGSLKRLGLSLIWNQSFLENLISINASLSGNYRRDKGSVESIIVDVSDFSWSTSFAGNVLLSKRYNWNATGSFSYNGPMKLAHEEVLESYRLSIGLRKTFSNDISLTMGVRNLLFNNPNKSKIDSNYEYHIKNKFDSRAVYAGISIPFGNMKAKGASSRSSSSKMKNRLKE